MSEVSLQNEWIANEFETVIYGDTGHPASSDEVAVLTGLCCSLFKNSPPLRQIREASRERKVTSLSEEKKLASYLFMYRDVVRRRGW